MLRKYVHVGRLITYDISVMSRISLADDHTNVKESNDINFAIIFVLLFRHCRGGYNGLLKSLSTMELENDNSTNERTRCPTGICHNSLLY